MATWVLYRDGCGHYAVGLRGEAVFAAAEHLGAFYSEFIRGFERRSDANAEKLLDEEVEAERDEQRERMEA
ncbi:MAG: hypothetical protein JRN06_07085 [Nitrososphaerota archaeon]|nr:hypothetical protein [Nitrososphaerota archaeon]MDG7024456.1 hypothetical protein [Nitrososphaerota archaeon]